MGDPGPGVCGVPAAARVLEFKHLKERGGDRRMDGHPGVPAAAPARVRVQRETEVSDIKSVQGPVAKVLNVIKCDETALQAASRAFAISCSRCKIGSLL